MEPANEGEVAYQHADGRFVALSWLFKRVDRTEGRAGVGEAHVFRSFATPELAKEAFESAGAKLVEKGFAKVDKIEFAPVPLAQWHEDGVEVRGIPKPKLRAATYPRPIATLLRDVEKRLARLGKDAKVRARFGKPASKATLAKVEKQLARPLPPSLRAFYLRHDGCKIHWSNGARTVDFELPPMRRMQVAERSGRTVLTLGDHVAVAFGEKPRGEACVVRVEGARLEVLAPSFGHFLDRAAKKHFAE